MAVTCPNIEDNPAFDAMAVRDSVDLFALGSDAQAVVVVTGMAVTGSGSAMSVKVAGGQVSINGITYDYTGGTVTVGAASTSDRRDTVVYTAGTGVQVIAGTPCGRRGAAARRRLGLAAVPEERLGRGAVAELTLTENALLTGTDGSLVRHGLVRFAALRRALPDDVFIQLGHDFLRCQVDGRHERKSLASPNQTRKYNREQPE